MLIPESAHRSEEFPHGATTVFVAEIACILCGRVLGTAVDTRWPPVYSVLIQMEGSRVLRRVELSRLRCPDCGGNTVTHRSDRASAPPGRCHRLAERSNPVAAGRRNGLSPSERRIRRRTDVPDGLRRCWSSRAPPAARRRRQTRRWS